MADFEKKIPIAEQTVEKLLHDIGGPAGAIAGAAELYALEDDEAGRKKVVEIIERGGKELNARIKFLRIAFGSSYANAPPASELEAIIRSWLATLKVKASFVAEAGFVLETGEIKPFFLALAYIASCAGGDMVLNAVKNHKTVELSAASTKDFAHDQDAAEALVDRKNVALLLAYEAAGKAGRKLVLAGREKSLSLILS